MRHKPYPRYRETGLESLKSVPEHWQVVPTKSVSSWNDDVLGEDTDPQKELQYVDISSVDAVAGILRVEPMVFKDSPSRARRKVRHGDVIISTVRTYLRAIASIQNPDDNLIVSTGFAVLRPKEGLKSAFSSYLFRSSYFIDDVIARSTGVSYPAINAGDLVQIRVAIPTVTEQVAIASFLNRETAKIDTLIAKQEKLIELLKEKRQAVISHAVTKGLDPTVPMKPSGVEWLGDVPVTFQVMRLKHASPEITVGIVVEPSKYYVEDGIPCFRSLNVRKMGLVGENLVFISEESNAQLKKSVLRAGDLVAVRTGQPGTTAVVEAKYDGTNCIDLIIIRRSDVFLSRYLGYFLNSDTAIMQYAAGSGGAIQQHFNVETAGNLVVAIPPLEEQARILAYLDKATVKFDLLIAKAEQAIALQKEHRIALISAAVTGKIDVREAVTVLQEAA